MSSIFSDRSLGEKAEYTDFERHSWSKMDIQFYRVQANNHRDIKTKAERAVVEKMYGIRYFCLLQLPYFDPPCMCIIDPMLLGSAKHCDVWKKTGLLTVDKLQDILTKVDSFSCPNDVGRIPPSIIIFWLYSLSIGLFCFLFSIYCLEKRLISWMQLLVWYDPNTWFILSKEKHQKE